MVSGGLYLMTILIRAGQLSRFGQYFPHSSEIGVTLSSGG